MKISKLSIILILFMLAWSFLFAQDSPKPPEDKAAAPSEAPAAEGEVTVGIITLSPPETYVVVEEEKTKKKRLYKEAEYEKIKKKDLKPVETVLIDTIEYRYKPVRGKVEFVSEEFELVTIKEKKAILKRDYAEKPKVVEEKELPIEEEVTIEEVEEFIKEEEPKKEMTAKRLVAELFYKIETKEISKNEWEVNLPTILDGLSNFGTVLGIVTKKTDELLGLEKKAKIYLNTSIGKGTLSSEGFLVESLSSRLKTKCGIKDDDLIKTINGHNIATIQDVAAVFSTFSGSPQTVTVKLLRDDKDLTLSYYIK